jgi:hypothetical protein
VRRFRALVAASGIVVVLAATALSLPRATLGVQHEGKVVEDDTVIAYVDGRRISIDQISRYYCDDFSYPLIQCSRLTLGAQARALSASVAGVDYATIYDLTNYSGGFMHVSQDYGSLLSIGWNDKISSFKGRNSETGRFWTDWYGTGTAWNFCCNQNVSSLGSYNNTFSSMQRT